MLLHGDNSNQVNPIQVTSIKRQRAGNKLDNRRNKNSHWYSIKCWQPDKAEVIANRKMLSNKIQLIKSYDEQILDSINTDANIEREIFESSEFKRAVSELIISFNM